MIVYSTMRIESFDTMPISISETTVANNGRSTKRFEITARYSAHDAAGHDAARIVEHGTDRNNARSVVDTRRDELDRNCQVSGINR
jgi:hypothetical protein